MPAVETWPPTAAGRKSFASPAEGASEPAPDGGDFDSVMQATLGPQAHKPAGKNSARTAKPSPASDTPAPAEAEPSARPAPSRKTEEKAKNPAATDGKSSSDPGPSNVPADTVQPLPNFFSPPLFLSNPFLNPIAVKSSAEQSGGVEKIPAADRQTAGAAASSASPETGKATPAILPAETLAKLGVLDPAQTSVPASQKNDAPEKIPARGDSKVPTLAAPTPEKDTEKAQAATSPATASTDSPGPVGDEALPASDTVSTAPEKAVVSDVNPAHSLEKAAERDGTGVAITSLPMKNPQKATKVAGPDVKVLPVGQDGDAVEKNLPTQLLVSPVRAAENRGSDQNFTFGDGSNHAAVTESAQTLNMVDLPSLADARMRALERTHDMLALHSMRLVESKSDVLSVVIKPAVGTELSLELHQHEGGVEAHATLTRGDHQFLSQHWPELQQRLELRGIKLAPLGSDAGFSTEGGGNFQRQQFSQEEEAQQASAFAEFAATSATGGATARLAAIHEGWESWA